jgi:hypothetical protein
VHKECWDYLTDALAEFHDQEITVLDLGGRDANGWHRVCELFPRAEYVTLDIEPGPGVDIVADAADWTPDRWYDVVICTEVFEHTPRWREICVTANHAIGNGGLFVATAAIDPRAPHSAIDGEALRPGEFYANVVPEEVRSCLDALDLEVEIATHPRGDVYVEARR